MSGIHDKVHRARLAGMKTSRLIELVLDEAVAAFNKHVRNVITKDQAIELIEALKDE